MRGRYNGIGLQAITEEGARDLIDNNESYIGKQTWAPKEQINAAEEEEGALVHRMSMDSKSEHDEDHRGIRANQRRHQTKRGTISRNVYS